MSSKFDLSGLKFVIFGFDPTLFHAFVWAVFVCEVHFQFFVFFFLGILGTKYQIDFKSVQKKISELLIAVMV